MNKIWQRRLTAAGIGILLLLRLLVPAVFSHLRSLLVDRRGEEAARAVFRVWTGSEFDPDDVVRVFREASDENESMQ